MAGNVRCPWAHWAFNRTKYAGRMCSHALATLYQAQADEMFGGKVKEVSKKPIYTISPFESTKKKKCHYCNNEAVHTVRHGGNFWPVCWGHYGGEGIEDDEGPGDTDEGTTASFHPFDTSGELEFAPIATEAAISLKEGEDPNDVLEYLATIVSNPTQIIAQAFKIANDLPEIVGPSHRGEHLINPHDNSTKWHHGTPKDFESFDHEEPEDENGDYEFDDRKHWNTHLGQHWTGLKSVAKDFARGKYNQDRTGKGGHVFTAELGIKNPKNYSLESHMDKEALDHAWSRNEAHDPQ